jgi:hypothetical protein
MRIWNGSGETIGYQKRQEMYLMGTNTHHARLSARSSGEVQRFLRF